MKTQKNQPQKANNFAIAELVSKMCKHFKLTINEYNNQMLGLGKIFIAGLGLPAELMAEGSEFAKLTWTFWAQSFYTRDLALLELIENPYLQAPKFNKFQARFDAQSVRMIGDKLREKFYAQFGDQIVSFFNRQNKAQNATKKESTAKPKKRNITVSKS